MIKALCDLSARLAATHSDYPSYGQSRIDNADTLLCISEKGRLERIVSLAYVEEDGTGRTHSRNPFFIVPFQKTRSSGICPYFLCDTPEYILGISPKTGEITRDKFEASSELHRRLLTGLSSTCAEAVRLFFEKWNPEEAFDESHVKDYMSFFKGRLLFRINGHDALDDEGLWKRWMEYMAGSASGHMALCPILGRHLQVAEVHSKIQNIYGGQTMGATLVSYNKPSFESYGLEKNSNAGMSEEAAYAYTSALNYLLKDGHSRFVIGKATYVCWADCAEDSYPDCLQLLLGVGPRRLDIYQMEHVMECVSKGRPVDFDEKELAPESNMHILGLSPNSGRLSVIMYQHNSFGSYLENISRHYRQMSMTEDKIPPGPYIVLRELMPPGKESAKIPDWIVSDFLNSILSGTRYPDAVFSGIVTRIHADRIINQTRVAMIKAFLLRNSSVNDRKEVSTMELNTKSDYQPYVLGRLFAVLDKVQQAASRTSSIRDKYFDSACTTPSVAFPSIMLLASKHLRKLERDKPGLGIYFEREIREVSALLHETFPPHLSLEEQGTFIIGYYHQLNEMSSEKENGNESN